MNNKQLFNKKHLGILPGSIVNPILPGSNNDNTDVLDEMNEDTSKTNNTVEDDIENNNLDNSSGDLVDVNGVVSGLWKLSSFKTKLIIIGIIAAFVGLIVFLILFITPLIHLDIIEYKGSSSSSTGHVSPSYAYCDSINVEGKLYDLEEYVAGVVQAEVGMFMNDSGAEEALKALSIAARTYAVYYTNGCKKTIENSDRAQTFVSNPNDSARRIANSTAGLIMTYDNDLFLSEYDSLCNRNSNCTDFVINVDGSYTVTYTKLPTGDKHSITLSDMTYASAIREGAGHGRGMSQYVAVQYSKEGMDYQEILDVFYSAGVEIASLKKLQIGNDGNEQGLDYIGTYTNIKNGKTYKNFKQYLYRSEEFTFKDKERLASYGCGTNAAGIVLSGEDDSITPMTLFIENHYTNGPHLSRYPYSLDSFSYCSSWSDGFCTKTNSNTKLSNIVMKDKLIDNLNNGGTAILFVNYSVDKCMVRGESWTGSQHFFTVLDYNPVDDTIYISNPGNNSSSQNGWIPINEFKCVHVALLMYPE